MNKNELTVSRNTTLLRVSKMANDAKDTSEVIKNLAAMSNQTAAALIGEQYLNHQYQIGYVYGALKANLDCLPDAIASRQKINGIPLDLAIKMQVDTFVLDVREASRASDMTIATKYDEKYRRLSELICGFGYNMYFIEDRFEEFFPKGSHMFVLGFATGYSETFHEIAAQAGITTDTTDPKTQDIWRNHPYFLERDAHEYRLDGPYLYMYHGGWNCTDDKTIPYGNNCRVVNNGVYDVLKARDISEFEDRPFDLHF